MTESLSASFERMAREFLEAHLSLRHEWREVPSRWWGPRKDLVFESPRAGVPSVFASIRDGQITVGTNEDGEDFERFGRELPELEVAQLAFARLVQLLREGGYFDA